MRKNLNRALAFILSFAMLLALLPISALAAPDCTCGSADDNHTEACAITVAEREAAAKKAEENTATATSAKPRLGVTVGTTNSSMSQKLPLGALIRKVEEGSPAQEGGLQIGDVIVEVDGDIVSGSSALVSKIAEYKEGDVITVKVFRAEGAGEAIDEKTNQIDLSKIGDGSYIDLKVTLRVIEDQKSSAGANA